jgi:hypothetical protein
MELHSMPRMGRKPVVWKSKQQATKAKELIHVATTRRTNAFTGCACVMTALSDTAGRAATETAEADIERRGKMTHHFHLCGL